MLIAMEVILWFKFNKEAIIFLLKLETLLNKEFKKFNNILHFPL